MISTNQVSVFVGGAQKSGTRSISRYFRKHQNMSVHKKNEGHFFDSDSNFVNDIAKESLLFDYHNNFTTTIRTKVLCDITPDYIFRKNSVKRIFNYNPNSTWIILLRNPVDRAYSAWNMEVTRQTENLTFKQAILSELKGNPKERSHDRFQYLERSQYYPQLLNLWKYFPKEQCHIYSAEFLWGKPIETLNDILNTLNITPNNAYNYQHTHIGSYNTKLTKSESELLISKLDFELNELPSLLGWSKNPWAN